MAAVPFDAGMAFSAGQDFVMGSAERLLRTPPPTVSAAQAVRFVRDHYGRDVDATLLSGERDRNFLISDAAGWSAILKFYNASDDAPTRALQHCALVHVRSHRPDCPVPHLYPTRDGRDEATGEVDGVGVAAVMIGRLPGVSPVAARLTCGLRANVGRIAAELSVALADYDHPEAGRTILWDIMQIGRLRELAGLIPEPELRAAIERWLDAHVAETLPEMRSLPHQPIHNDLSLSNVLVDPESRSKVVGVIDFGDIVRAPRVNEFAIAASYFLTPADDPALAIAEIVRGGAPVLRLSVEEIRLMPELLRARLATRILLSGWRARLFHDNRDYILRSNRAAWQIWHRMDQVSASELSERVVELSEDRQT